MTPKKRVVLFGRTGDGKSTVANALVTGGVEEVIFESSDSARGCTAEIKKATGRGWTVTDTVGLGEADTGTISNAEARAMLTKFLKSVKDEYSHIIFVQRANRVTIMDEMNWLLFEQIFDGAEEAFVILFTAADEKWLEENKAKLPSYMEGVTTLAVDFPPISNRSVTERRNKAIREKSLQKLEVDLAKNFEERGNKYSVPNIARMNDAQLEQKSSSLMEFIVESIKSMFSDPRMWIIVASRLASLISVISTIAQLAGV